MRGCRLTGRGGLLDLDAARALVFEEMAAGMDDVLCGRRAPAIANPRAYEPARIP